MMKKLLFIFIGVALVIGILGVAGFVYAQNSDPAHDKDTDEDRFENFFGRGHWTGFGGDEGVLAKYLLPAFVKVFGLDDEQVQAFQKARETMDSIKDAYSMDEIQAMRQEAFSEALDTAVADGAITQEDADRILERSQRMGDRSIFADPRKGGRMTLGWAPLGEMGSRSDRMPEEMLGFDVHNHILAEYMEAALADALNIPLDEFEAMKEEGFNLADYADEHGLTPEELQDLMVDVYTQVIHNALEDEAITQDQADFLLERLENFEGRFPFHFSPRNHDQ